MSIPVFIDSDVIISSLISTKGAAYSLLNNNTDIKLFISDVSIEEMNRVVRRLHLEEKQLAILIKKRFSKVSIKKSFKTTKEEYTSFTFDENDSHIVAGAQESKVKFIITYNMRDYRIDKIKKDLNIITMTPAQFLQYLRSII